MRCGVEVARFSVVVHCCWHDLQTAVLTYLYILWTSAGNISASKIVIFACTMPIGGPPVFFLRVLDVARPVHAIHNFIILVVMAAVSVSISIHEHIRKVIHHLCGFMQQNSGLFLLHCWRMTRSPLLTPAQVTSISDHPLSGQRCAAPLL